MGTKFSTTNCDRMHTVICSGEVPHPSEVLKCMPLLRKVMDGPMGCHEKILTTGCSD